MCGDPCHPAINPHPACRDVEPDARTVGRDDAELFDSDEIDITDCYADEDLW